MVQGKLYPYGHSLYHSYPEHGAQNLPLPQAPFSWTARTLELFLTPTLYYKKIVE